MGGDLSFGDYGRDRVGRDRGKSNCDDQPSPVELGFREMSNIGRSIMLNWALTFLIVALAAAVLGFGGIAGEAAWIAKVLFVVFLVMFLISALTGRRAPLS